MHNFLDKTKHQLSALSPSNFNLSSSLGNNNNNAIAQSYTRNEGDSDTLEGYLLKKGEKGALKTWKNRWFILKGKKLFYYKTHTTEQPQGFIGKFLSLIDPTIFYFLMHLPIQLLSAVTHTDLLEVEEVTYSEVSNVCTLILMMNIKVYYYP